LPITVYASPAAQALQQEISEHSVAAAPLRAFTREFVRSAGGNDGTMFPVTQGAPAFVRHVRPGFSDSAAVACVDETYGIRLERALESDLQVPHRDGGAAKIISVGIVRHQVIVIGAFVDIVGPVTAKVHDHQVIGARFGQEIEQSRMNLSEGGILVLEKK